MKKTREDIIDNALEWANFRECIPLEQEDIVVLGEFFKIRIPQRFEKFEYSNNPNHIRATGGHKIIFNTLSTLKTKLLKKFDENRVENRGRKKGCTFTEEQKFKQKISSKKRVEESGIVCGYEIKPVVQLSKYDGTFIAKYNSVRDATVELEKPKNRSDIRSCCIGLRNKQSAFGFKWMYMDDYYELKNLYGDITIDEINNFIKYKYNNKIS